MSPMIARSRRPMSVSVLMDASSAPISSADKTEVFPFFHAVPRTADGVRRVQWG